MIELKTAEETKRTVAESNKQAGLPWHFSALQAAAMLVIVVLCLEYLFALAGIGEEEYLKPDPVLGYTPMPNKHVTKSGEGLGQALYNKYGLPEPERALAKPPGTYRIVVLGDSFVEALQVKREQNFSYLLEEALNKKYPAKHFEVMNFGVAGYSIGQMYLRLKQLAFQFNPDMVLLAVRSDTTFVLRPTPAIDLTSARPSFFIDGNNGLLVDYTVHKEWLRTRGGRRMQMTGWLREHSRIWGVVSVAVQQLMIWYQGLSSGTSAWGAAVTNKQTAFAAKKDESKTAQVQSENTQAPLQNAQAPASDSAKDQSGTKAAAEKANAGTFMIGNTPVSSKDYFDARDRGIRYFWPIVDAIMTAIKKECDAHKCKLVMVQLPGAGGRSNELETSMFAQSAGRLGVPFADKTAALAKEPASKLYFDVHFNELGHKLFAREIEPYIFEQVTTK